MWWASTSIPPRMRWCSPSTRRARSRPWTVHSLAYRSRRVVPAPCEGTVEPGLEIHVILDNYATHKHEKVRRWLEKHPRVHFHFVPTGSSWLNLVERFFSEIDERQLRRLAVTSVGELVNVINAYISNRNEDPTPFIWTKSARQIIKKIERGLRTLEAVH